MAIVEMRIDTKAEAFLLSPGFKSLCYAMNCINSSTENETVGALANIAVEDFVLNLSKGQRGGYGMRLVRAAALRKSGDKILKTGQGFPQIDLDNNKYVDQLSIQVGSQTLSAFQFPAHTVVEESSRVLAASVHKVSLKYGTVTPDLVDCIMVFAHRSGGISYYERPNMGKWGKDQRLSEELSRIIGHTVLSTALGMIS